MIFSRRHFVAGASSLVLAGNGIVPSLAGQKEKKNLIIVMMRGGMDGLTAIPYIGDSTLSDERPSINVTKSTKITSDFAIHPKLKIFVNSGIVAKPLFYMPHPFHTLAAPTLRDKI